MVSFEQLGTEGSSKTSLVLTSILTGNHLLAELDELGKMCLIGTEQWVNDSELEEIGFLPDRLAELARLGVLISDSAEASLSEIRTREESIQASHWPPAASIFHHLNQNSESRRVPFGKVLRTADREIQAEVRAAAFVSANGAPPPAFFSHEPHSSTIELPLTMEEMPLLGTLLRRRTCRFFQESKPVCLASLTQLLRVVFGAWAQRSLPGVGELLLKTSPSGGSLHPIEAYPVIFASEGIASGIYHYRVQDHVLETVLQRPEDELRKLGIFWGQGQEFVGSAGFLVVLVARFDRNFWKYRERENSYAVVLQDAGHLSQTFQLVASELGLGAFYTAAINGESIWRILGLDYPAQAPIGILGAGHAGEPSASAVSVEAYEPRRQNR